MRQTPERVRRSLRSRLYFFSDKVRFRLGWRKRSARWIGFWLGLLRHHDFHALDDAFYNKVPLYRSDEHNGRGPFDWEIKCLSRYFPTTGSLLVIGAGGGREVLALSKRGFTVEGYECNPTLVEFAKDFLNREGCKGSVDFIARDCVPTGTQCYDGVIVGWSAYMLIPGREQRIKFLQAIKERLEEGGPVLLSFFSRSHDTPHLCVVRERGNWWRRLRRQEMIEMGDDLAPNYVHHFTREEIEGELAEAGFSLAFYEGQGKGPRDSGHAVGIKKESAPAN